MATLEIESYAETKRPGPDKSALNPARGETIESEIAEYEWTKKRDAALALGLTQVAVAAALSLRRIELSRNIPYPLMTAEEERVWRAFLPTVYSTEAKPPKPGLGTVQVGGARPMDTYRFDTPPLSVMEEWLRVREQKLFDVYEIWTPERPMPEPILAGYRAQVGPFLIARWGEALEPFEAIKAKVETDLAAQRQLWQGIQQAQINVPSITTTGFQTFPNTTLGVTGGAGGLANILGGYLGLGT